MSRASVYLFLFFINIFKDYIQPLWPRDALLVYQTIIKLSQHITTRYVTLNYIEVHYVTLHYIVLHHVTLRCIKLHYVTLRYIIFGASDSLSGDRPSLWPIEIGAHLRRDTGNRLLVRVLAVSDEYHIPCSIRRAHDHSGPFGVLCIRTYSLIKNCV